AHDPSLAGPTRSLAVPGGPIAAGAGAEPADPAVPPVLPLVGRDAEWQALRTDLSDAAAGRGRIALLGGEPGIGKTRLAEELAADALAQGTVVVWGRCYDGRGAPAFWP